MQPKQNVMPETPTPTTGPGGQPGYGQQEYGQGQQGLGQGQQGNGQGQQGYAAPINPRSNDPYANTTIPGRNPVSGYSRGMTVPQIPPTPTVGSNYGYPTSVNNITNPYGLPSSSNPMANPSAGGVSKPFSNYQAPSGFSPWQLLNQPTQGGTINPYTAYVQPVMTQQNVNSHLSEQINGVQTQQRYGAGTPGMELNTGGNGLVNPQIFQNYLNYYPH